MVPIDGPHYISIGQHESRAFVSILSFSAHHNSTKQEGGTFSRKANQGSETWWSGPDDTILGISNSFGCVAQGLTFFLTCNMELIPPWCGIVRTEEKCVPCFQMGTVTVISCILKLTPPSNAFYLQSPRLLLPGWTKRPSSRCHLSGLALPGCSPCPWLSPIRCEQLLGVEAHLPAFPVPDASVPEQSMFKWLLHLFIIWNKDWASAEPHYF